MATIQGTQRRVKTTCTSETLARRSLIPTCTNIIRLRSGGRKTFAEAPFLATDRGMELGFGQMYKHALGTLHIPRT